MNIITHFVAGFPDYQRSLEVARGLIAAGAFALEMQIPFSDPNADGPVIEGACRVALENGFRVEDAWRLLENIRAESEIPVFVMSYASLVFAPGVENFVRRAKSAGASGFIIPDLVPGADEGLYAAAQGYIYPVYRFVQNFIQSPIGNPGNDYRYSLGPNGGRGGITGAYTELGMKQEMFLRKLKTKGWAGNRGEPGGERAFRVMAGFGIQRSEQAAAVTAIADAAIVGSALVKAIDESGPVGPGETARELVGKLKGGGSIPTKSV